MAYYTAALAVPVTATKATNTVACVAATGGGGRPTVGQLWPRP